MSLRAHAQKKKGTKQCCCSEQHCELPCHHGISGGLSRVTQACAAHAPAQQKKRTAVQDRWVWLDSQQSLETLTSKETNTHASHLSLSTLPPLSRPPRKKNTQNNNNKCRQLHKSCTVKARPTATTSGLCPAPHPRTLITKLETFLTG